MSAQTTEDRRFLSWLHKERCIGWNIVFQVCDGPIQAAHFRDMTGTGRKEATSTCIPLCRKHHEDYDQAKGYFLGWPKDERKLWHRARQLEVRSLYEASEGRQG